MSVNFHKFPFYVDIVERVDIIRTNNKVVSYAVVSFVEGKAGQGHIIRVTLQLHSY